MKSFKEMVSGTFFRGMVAALGLIVAFLLVFALGVKVGERRAHYSSLWGANYERNFVGGPRGMMGGGFGQAGPDGIESRRPNMMRDFGGRDFRNGHGVSGTIVSIADNMIVVKDRDGKENTISVSDKTIIKNGRTDGKITDLKNDQRIVVIGNPGDNGTVQADLIRVFANNNW